MPAAWALSQRVVQFDILRQTRGVHFREAAAEDDLLAVPGGSASRWPAGWKKRTSRPAALEQVQVVFIREVKGLVSRHGDQRMLPDSRVA